VNRDKYIFFAPEFYPIPGGISEYTKQLAKAFHSAGRLSYLITNQYQKRNYPFPVMSLKNSWASRTHNKMPLIIRKVFSLMYLVHTRLFLYKNLLRIYLRRRNDIVLINSLFINYSWFFARSLTKLNIKYSLLIHGLDILEKKEQNEKQLAVLIERSHSLIINSKATVELVKKELPYVKFPEIIVINPPFDKHQFNTFDLLKKEYFTNDSSQKIISCICRLVERKGVDIAIKSISELLMFNPEWVFIIGGDGEERLAIEKLIKDLNLEGRIKLLGKITEQEKYSLLTHSEVFIMPNHTLGEKDIEGFGISFVEAQYFQNVVIGGKSGGVVESVADKISGFLINFDGSERQQIRNYIEYLISSEENRLKMAKTAKQYVVENFELSTLINRLKTWS